jgi:LuxR family transcriptional regulator, transcriptional regulator of spore coat protein
VYPQRDVLFEGLRGYLEDIMAVETIDLRTVTSVDVPLTRRERIILSNLDEDTTLEEIASRLWVSRNTVKSQVRSVYRKLGVSTRADAVAVAREYGLR